MTTRSELWVKCETCGHVWMVMKLPAELTAVAEAARNAACPSCGVHERILMAGEKDIPA